MRGEAQAVLPRHGEGPSSPEVALVLLVPRQRGRARSPGEPGDRLMGPVQVLVVGYEQPAFTGEVLAELTRLTDEGLVRLVDVLLVTRAADGTFDTVDVAPGRPDDDLTRGTGRSGRCRTRSPGV